MYRVGGIIMKEILWWGYIHENGSIQVKRYLDDYYSIEDARGSPYVKEVYVPFEAKDREDAIDIIKKMM
jgi:hypothetical protein